MKLFCLGGNCLEQVGRSDYVSGLRAVSLKRSVVPSNNEIAHLRLRFRLVQGRRHPSVVSGIGLRNEFACEFRRLLHGTSERVSRIGFKMAQYFHQFARRDSPACPDWRVKLAKDTSDLLFQPAEKQSPLFAAEATYFSLQPAACNNHPGLPTEHTFADGIGEKATR